MVKESVKKFDSLIMYQYAHYSFELEVHPDDDPEKLMQDINSRNLDVKVSESDHAL